MKNVLIVVDMQNDFVDGSLGTKEALSILPEVTKLIDDPSFDSIIVTMDTHPADYMRSREGRYLPVEHCIKDTEGWQIHPVIAEALQKHKDKVTCIQKPTFGSERLVSLLKEHKPERIVLCGLCTDICVLSNALLIKAALYETDMAFVESACAGVTPHKHACAIEVMRSNQIDIL